MTVITPQRNLMGLNSADMRQETDRMLTRLAFALNNSQATGTQNADAETVVGTGTGWTLAHAPAPPASLILVQRLAGFGGVVLISPTDYTLNVRSITTVNSITSGLLTAWYRF